MCGFFSPEKQHWHVKCEYKTYLTLILKFFAALLRVTWLYSHISTGTSADMISFLIWSVDWLKADFKSFVGEGKTDVWWWLEPGY